MLPGPATHTTVPGHEAGAQLAIIIIPKAQLRTSLRQGNPDPLLLDVSRENLLEEQSPVCLRTATPPSSQLHPKS